MANHAFPATLAYLASLPTGWASFPACRANGALLAQQRQGLDGILEDVPPELWPLRDVLAADGGWIPEVFHVGLVLAIRDARFTSDEACLAWLGKVNREVLDRPEVTALFGTMRPGDVLRGVPRLWELFHDGCPARVEVVGESAARITVDHPAGLYPPFALASHRQTLAIALTKAGAAKLEVKVRTVPHGAGERTELACAWR